MAITIRRVSATAVYPLRHSVLRSNQDFSECEFPGDDEPDTVHFAACTDDAVVGIASVYRQPPPSGVQANAWRLRGMATEPEFRGTGIGGELLTACIEHVAAQGGALIWCNARTPAVRFYEHHGFCCVGDEFELPGIGPHFLMLKQMEEHQNG